ncbi:hypothetical protein CSUI_008328 [Cystoisospora suis]|uniref:Uncharacterized protein n=1 Tax=Cystoisospora suis TaxID=483139 RepID=A0A2C6KJX0_9APIC|nr:hypothetical protein CSUI_008328 [Cystoisospora suis]
MQPWNRSEGSRRSDHALLSAAASRNKGTGKVTRNSFECKPEAEDFSASSSTNWSSSDCNSSVDETINGNGNPDWQSDNLDLLAGSPISGHPTGDDSYWLLHRDGGQCRGDRSVVLPALGSESQNAMFPTCVNTTYLTWAGIPSSSQTTAVLPFSSRASGDLVDSSSRSPAHVVTRETESGSPRPLHARKQYTAVAPSTCTAEGGQNGTGSLEMKQKRMTGAESRAVVLGLLHDLLETLPTANVEDVLESLEPLRNFSNADNPESEGISRTLSEDCGRTESEQTMCPSSVGHDRGPGTHTGKDARDDREPNSTTGRTKSAAGNKETIPNNYSDITITDCCVDGAKLAHKSEEEENTSTHNEGAQKQTKGKSIRVSPLRSLTDSAGHGELGLAARTSPAPYMVVPASPVAIRNCGAAQEGYEASPPTFSLGHRRLFGEGISSGPQQVVSGDAAGAPCDQPEEPCSGVTRSMTVTEESACNQSDSPAGMRAFTTIEKGMADMRDWLAWANSFGYVPGLYSSQHLENYAQGVPVSHMMTTGGFRSNTPPPGTQVVTANMQPTTPTGHATPPLSNFVSLQSLKQQEQGLFQEVQAFLTKRSRHTPYPSMGGPLDGTTKGGSGELGHKEQNGKVVTTQNGAIEARGLTSDRGVEGVSSRLKESHTAQEGGSDDIASLPDGRLAVETEGRETLGQATTKAPESTTRSQPTPKADTRRGCPPPLKPVFDDVSQLGDENDVTGGEGDDFEEETSYQDGITVVALPERRMPVTPQHLLQTPRPAVLKGSQSPSAGGSFSSSASITGDAAADEELDRAGGGSVQDARFDADSPGNRQQKDGVDKANGGLVAEETVLDGEGERTPTEAGEQPDEQQWLPEQLAADDEDSCSVYGVPLHLTTAVSLDELFPDSMNAGTQTSVSDFWTRLGTPRGASFVFSRNRRLPHSCRSGPPEVFLYDPSASLRHAGSPQEVPSSGFEKTESLPPLGTAQAVPQCGNLKDMPPFPAPANIANPYVVNLQAAFSPSLPAPLISVSGYPSVTSGHLHPPVGQTLGRSDGSPFDVSLGYQQPYMPAAGLSMPTAPYFYPESTFNTAPGNLYGWGPDGLPIWGDPSLRTPVVGCSQFSF